MNELKNSRKKWEQKEVTEREKVKKKRSKK